MIAVLFFIRKHGLPALATFDLIAPSMMIGLALGRIGCFLNGCCYGGPTSLPWAVRFPPGSPPYVDQVASGLLLDANPPAEPAGPPGTALQCDHGGTDRLAALDLLPVPPPGRAGGRPDAD